MYFLGLSELKAVDTHIHSNTCVGHVANLRVFKYQSLCELLMYDSCFMSTYMKLWHDLSI